MKKVMVLLGRRMGRMGVGPYIKHTDLNNVGFYC